MDYLSKRRTFRIGSKSIRARIQFLQRFTIYTYLLGIASFEPFNDIPSWFANGSRGVTIG